MSDQPRVTLGIATYRRHEYLAEAVDSCLNQTYADLEVLVVVDGPGTPEIHAILDERVTDPRLRVFSHDENRGIAEAYNTITREGRGELIAMLGDDDVAMPDRVARQVAVFDAHPDTIVVHGDAQIIDERGVQRGSWRTRDFSPGELQRHLVREHNTLVDPSRMVHRRAYELAGGYRAQFTLAQDFDWWLRALPHGRFRHLGGEPLIKLRRHGENFSDESAQTLEVEQVELALREHIERTPVRSLVPELDWPVLDERAAERTALLKLATAFEHRGLPLPRLAAELRALAAQIGEPAPPRRDRGKLLMTAFGWNDSGGGTTIPRLAAKELARRGWDVTVFHAATATIADAPPYTVSEWEEDGVRLVGIHNRDHGLWDLDAPWREVDDPPITAAFAALVDRLKPDVAHVHNLHNLGAALLDVLASRGIRSYFTTHNYWLVCPRAYLFQSDLSLCDGPQGGAACSSCIGHQDPAGYAARLDGIRERFGRAVETCMAVSHGVRHTLIGQGYDPEQIEVVEQCVPVQDETWAAVGASREPGRVDPDWLVVGFFGSVYPHKGAHQLVEAAQSVNANVLVRIHGEVPDQIREQLTRLDRRGVVELCGAFSPSELPGLLAQVDAAALPSVWWDCAPLTAGECLAARVPVIAPRMGGLAECIQDGVDGLAYDGLDVEGMATAIERLATEPGLLESLQTNIRAPRGFATWIDDLERYYATTNAGRVSRYPCSGTGNATLDQDGRPLAVRWTGDHRAGTSLARINREVSGTLASDTRFVVQRHALDGGAPRAPLPHPPDVEIRHRWPPDFEHTGGGRLVLIQPWEFGGVPQEWVDPIRDEVDELWVPSEYVRGMYVAGGVPAEQVHVIANGVDLAQFAPDGHELEVDGLPGGSATRFLFVGGAIARKGPDVLLAAWREAFGPDDDVVLIIKDFGADGVYANGDRDPIAAAIADPAVAPVIHLNSDLSDDEVAALYRTADVLVHPYRGEGFAMPVLEAMASGLPVIATAGGPTDEFCPETAGWRIPSQRVVHATRQVGPFELTGPMWDLEPDRAALAGLLREAHACGADARRERGDIGRAAAEAYGWDQVAAQYAERIRAVCARPPRVANRPAEGVEADGGAPRVLAAPAWRTEDRLGDLLLAWQRSASSGTLVLLADPLTDGSGEDLEARATSAAAAAGADLSACPDIAIRYEPHYPGRDAALLAHCDAYVPLHDGMPGLTRQAEALGVRVIEPDRSALAALGVDHEQAAA
ncbi:MAG: glycosyltransferase [Baekduia sp.]